MTELERYKEAVRVVRDGLAIVATVDTDGLCDTGYTPQYVAEDTIESIDAILNPPPVYEEVTVERWECDECKTVRQVAPVLDTHYDCCQADKKEFTKLTGTRRVQVAQKVERSVEVYISELGLVWSAESGQPPHEILDKKGTFTLEE